MTRHLWIILPASVLAIYLPLVGLAILRPRHPEPLPATFRSGQRISIPINSEGRIYLGKWGWIPIGVDEMSQREILFAYDQKDPDAFYPMVMRGRAFTVKAGTRCRMLSVSPEGFARIRVGGREGWTFCECVVPR